MWSMTLLTCVFQLAGGDNMQVQVNGQQQVLITPIIQQGGGQPGVADLHLDAASLTAVPQGETLGPVLCSGFNLERTWAVDFLMLGQ